MKDDNSHILKALTEGEDLHNACELAFGEQNDYLAMAKNARREYDLLMVDKEIVEDVRKALAGGGYDSDVLYEVVEVVSRRADMIKEVKSNKGR